MVLSSSTASCLTLRPTTESTKEALESAIIRKDLVTAKAIPNLAGRNLGKVRGVQPQRTITTQGNQRSQHRRSRLKASAQRLT
ncbi:capsid and scaffold [Enterobacter phage 02_vB_Eclo_IJM]|nr:capsid and scaffold [Enterobacter phage 02_vB_Eclo_IJM]